MNINDALEMSDRANEVDEEVERVLDIVRRAALDGDYDVRVEIMTARYGRVLTKLRQLGFGCTPGAGNTVKINWMVLT